MMRNLLMSLRRKLIRIHQRQGCIATIEDFVIERVTDRTMPYGKELVGKL